MAEPRVLGSGWGGKAEDGWDRPGVLVVSELLFLLCGDRIRVLWGRRMGCAGVDPF